MLDLPYLPLIYLFPYIFEKFQGFGNDSFNYQNKSKVYKLKKVF